MALFWDWALLEEEGHRVGLTTYSSAYSLPELSTSWSSEMWATSCVLPSLGPRMDCTFPDWYQIHPPLSCCFLRFCGRAMRSLTSSVAVSRLHYTMPVVFSLQTHQHDNPRWEPKRHGLFWFSCLRPFLLERAAGLAGFWNGVVCDNCFGILEVLWYWIGGGWGVISLK